MLNRLTLPAVGLLILALSAAILTARHYQQQSTHWRDTARQSQQAMKTAYAALARQQRQQQQIATLDKQHTEELAHAKATIDDLRHAVAVGTQRLQLNATCPVSVSHGTTRTPGVADVAQPRLTDAAKRHHWHLRQRIATARSQIAGLQHYIRAVCPALKTQSLVNRDHNYASTRFSN